MKKEKNFRTIAVIAIIITIFGLSIGYATLVETLRINTATTLEGSTWKVEFENLSEAAITGTANVTTPATLTATLISLDISLKKPGDKVVYTFDVANNGDIDAKLSAAPTITGLTEATSAHVNYSLTYENDDAILANDSLDIDEVRTLKLTIEYDPEATEVVSSNTVLNIDAALIYIQK